MQMTLPPQRFKTDVLHVTTTTLPDDIPDGSNSSTTSTRVVTSAADVNLSGSSLAESLSMEHDQTGCSDHEGKRTTFYRCNLSFCFSK